MQQESKRISCCVLTTLTTSSFLSPYFHFYSQSNVQSIRPPKVLVNNIIATAGLIEVWSFFKISIPPPGPLLIYDFTVYSFLSRRKASGQFIAGGFQEEGLARMGKTLPGQVWLLQCRYQKDDHTYWFRYQNDDHMICYDEDNRTMVNGHMMKIKSEHPPHHHGLKGEVPTGKGASGEGWTIHERSSGEMLFFIVLKHLSSPILIFANHWPCRSTLVPHQAFMQVLIKEHSEYVFYVNSALDYEGALAFARSLN